MKITKIVWILPSVIFLGFVLYICANMFGTPWGRMYFEKKMTTYLNEKYDSTFVVQKMSFNPLGSGYQGTAYPMNDPSITFTVQQSISEKSGYTDMYPSAFWKTDHAAPMKAFILDLFPNLEQSTFTIEPQFGEIVGPHIPTLRSINLDVGTTCLLTIKLKQNWFELSPDQQQAEMDKIRKISAYLQSHHFPVFVQFFYNTKTVDNTNLKAIFITENGEIVER